MRMHRRQLGVITAALAGGTFMLWAGLAGAASESQRICEAADGTWDKSTKTCTYPPVETRPGNNKGNAVWTTTEETEAHGTIKNQHSETNSDCGGPGGSESNC